MCTKVVHHIRAVLFRIIYYWCALSEPSYYVLVKQFITFLFSWGGGSIIANFVSNFVAIATGVDGRKCDWQHSMARPRKPFYRHKTFAKISYASRVKQILSQISLPWQRGSVGEKCDWQHSMAHPRKPPYRRKNLAKISYASRVIAHFVPNFVAMATREGPG